MARRLERVAEPPHPADHERVSHRFRDGLLAAIPSLRAFAFSLIGRCDRADDLVQETLIKAWAHHASFQPGTNLRAWLYTILRNEFYSQMRKKGREIEDVDGVYLAQPRRPSRASTAISTWPTCALRWRELPADQREALLLVAASGFSYEQAADDLRRRRGHDQEPRQPRPQPPRRNAGGQRRGRVRAGCDLRGRHSVGPQIAANQFREREALCRVIDPRRAISAALRMRFSHPPTTRTWPIR